MGFQRVTSLCYAPGFHEPNGTSEALVNRVAFDGLPDDLRSAISAACRMETLHSMAESAWRNAEALRALVEEDGVELRPYPPEILAALRDTSNDVVAGLANGGDLDREIYKSYARALQKIAPWGRRDRAALPRRPPSRLTRRPAVAVSGGRGRPQLRRQVAEAAVAQGGQREIDHRVEHQVLMPLRQAAAGLRHQRRVEEHHQRVLEQHRRRLDILLGGIRPIRCPRG